MIYLKKFNRGETELVGAVLKGDQYQILSLPGNATMTVPGKISKINYTKSLLIELEAHHN